MPIDTQHPLFYTLKIKCQGYLLPMHNDAELASRILNRKTVTIQEVLNFYDTQSSKLP